MSSYRKNLEVIKNRLSSLKDEVLPVVFEETERILEDILGDNPRKKRIWRYVRSVEVKIRKSNGALAWTDPCFLRRPYITIGTMDIVAVENGRYREYARISSDPEIGNFEGTAKEIMAVILCHEMAHVVRRSIHFSGSSSSIYEFAKRHGLPETAHFAKKEEYHRPHGAAWRAIYRVLRKNVLRRIDKSGNFHK